MKINNYSIINKIKYKIYWFIILLANLTGKIIFHSIRHLIYRRIFKINLSKNSIIYCGCRFFKPWGISIGENSIVGDNAFLDGRKGIYIGNNVNIASELRIYTAEHDIASPDFISIGEPVIIKDWVYIGSRVIILPGVTIHEGAVVTSGAVVTKDVRAWTMVGGVPAKYIKERPIVKYTLDTKNKAYFQ